MSTREYLSAAFELERAEHNGTFKGRAAVYNREFETEYGPVIIKPGTFADSLKQDADRFVILWQHDQHEPIGRPIDVRDGPEGIDIIGKLSDTTRGRDALILLRDRVVKHISIGLDRISEIKGRAGQATRLFKAKLWEFSLVTFGAAGGIGARVTDVHRAPQVKIKELPLEVMRARVLQAEHEARWGKLGAAATVQPSAAEARLVRELLAYLRPRCRLGNVTVEWFDDVPGWFDVPEADGWAEVGISTIAGTDSTIHLRRALGLERLARVLLHEAGHVHHRHRIGGDLAEAQAYSFERYWESDLEYSRVVASALGY